MPTSGAVDQLAEVFVHGDDQAVLLSRKLKDGRIWEPDIDVAHEGGIVLSCPNEVFEASTEARVDE